MRLREAARKVVPKLLTRRDVMRLVAHGVLDANEANVCLVTMGEEALSAATVDALQEAYRRGYIR